MTFAQSVKNIRRMETDIILNIETGRKTANAMGPNIFFDSIEVSLKLRVNAEVMSENHWLQVGDNESRTMRHWRANCGSEPLLLIVVWAWAFNSLLFGFCKWRNLKQTKINGEIVKRRGNMRPERRKSYRLEKEGWLSFSPYWLNIIIIPQKPSIPNNRAKEALEEKLVGWSPSISSTSNINTTPTPAITTPQNKSSAPTLLGPYRVARTFSDDK